MNIKLFSPLKLRGVEIPNRIIVSPMCQYSADNGMPNDWHFVHLGSRAVGGAGMIIVEATSVTPEGRISPHDLGLWNDSQATAFQHLTRFIDEQGSIPAIQLAHAGRKAATCAPWTNNGGSLPESEAWQIVAPSAIPFTSMHQTPKSLGRAEIEAIVFAFRDAARRSVSAGFRILELHMAHGYLIHQFLSPLTNTRTDEFGGSLENRIRFPLQIVSAIRSVVPESMPVMARISATDWVAGGWEIEQSVQLVRALGEAGVDAIDCSSGGNIASATIPVGPGYQVPFASRIRGETGLPTAAVGFITSPEQAEQIIRTGQADMVVLAREFLRDPYWPLHAARQLKQDIPWPKQYLRAKQS
jgi:2,4-dienoyl-CoA reductase-like NADH-dependent reductase (Old Yellow Enzyme family)